MRRKWQKKSKPCISTKSFMCNNIFSSDWCLAKRWKKNFPVSWGSATHTLQGKQIWAVLYDLVLTWPWSWVGSGRLNGCILSTDWGCWRKAWWAQAWTTICCSFLISWQWSCLSTVCNSNQNPKNKDCDCYPGQTRTHDVIWAQVKWQMRYEVLAAFINNCI